MTRTTARPVLPRRVMPPDPATAPALRLPRGRRLSLALRLGLPEAEQSVRAALAATGGRLAPAARLLGVSHRTACRWAASRPEVRGWISAARGDHDSNVIDNPR